MTTMIAIVSIIGRQYMCMVIPAFSPLLVVSVDLSLRSSVERAILFVVAWFRWITRCAILWRRGSVLLNLCATVAFTIAAAQG